MIKLIIFDWDDVFTRDSIKGYYKCFHKALKEVGVTLDPAEEERRIKEKWGSGEEEQFEILLHEHPELVQKAVEIYRDNLFGDTFVECLSVVPDSPELLERLAKKYTLAVATGAHPKILTERLFPKFQIPDVFAQIITIYDLDDPAHVKPHPYMVQKILQTQDISPEEAIVVGDAPGDMQMAWSAGVEPIAVLTGHLTEAQAKDLGVRHIIEDVTKLEEELEHF
jgi:phosphoglycolate phosphatase-like HAD superfamily hydrolase